MEFPISRERLQKYKENEAVIAEIKQRISKEIKQICKDVEIKVLTTNERKYIYRISGSVKHGEIRPQISGVNVVNSAPCLEPLLGAIIQTFPDCTITIDPLDTYIIIDWS